MALQCAQSHQFLRKSDFSFKSYKSSVHFDIPSLGTDGGRTDGTVAPPRANCPADVSRHCYGLLLVPWTRSKLASIVIIISFFYFQYFYYYY